MKILSFLLAAFFIFFLVSYFYFHFFYEEPVYVWANEKIENVKIQPKDALEIAKPLIEEKGAVVVFREDKNLKFHIVLYKGWYYVMKTNYPAKTNRFYLQPAVMVNAQSGEVGFKEK